MTNVVLITVDCLRADHLGCMDYHRDTSPFLDKLAEKGLFFTNAFANGPNTRHSVPSFLSSTYPLLFLDEANGKRFHPGRTSIAEVLKKQGYSTAGIHSNPYVSSFYGYDRGFDFFNDFLVGQVEGDEQQNPVIKKIREGMKGVKALFFHQLPHETGEEINQSVFDWLESTDDPFFLWIHYMDVHMPYVPPNESLRKLNLPSYLYWKKVWMGKKIDDIQMREKIKDKEVQDYVNLYDGTIRYTDEMIKELVSKVEERFSDTLFIITSDHGEEFREHGGLSHVEKLYDELLHVPLIFYKQDLESRVIEKPVGLTSVSPSILEFLDVNREISFTATSFRESDEFVISEALGSERLTSYRDRGWKMIFSKKKRELYDLTNDPLEQNNVYSLHKSDEHIKEIEKRLQHHILNTLEERKRRQTHIQKEKIRQAVGKVKI